MSHYRVTCDQDDCDRFDYYSTKLIHPSNVYDMKKIQTTLIFLLIMLNWQSSYATKIKWIVGAPDENWDNPTNWDLGRIPIVSDSVYTGYGDHIELPSNYTAEIKYMSLLGTLTIPATSELIFTNGKFNALGTLDNYGTITINDSPAIALACSTQAANRPFHNYGVININNAGQQGLVILNEQVLTNEPGGLIHIQNSGLEGISLGDFQFGILDNEGEILIENPVNDIAIKIVHPDAEYNNLECGKTNLYNKIQMVDGIFNNYGFLTQMYLGDNDFGDLALTELYNYAVIEDWHDSFNSSDFDFQALWVSYIPYALIKTGQPFTVFPVGTLGATNTGNSIFADELLTINAGAFDKTTNIWIPNAAANGNNVFYLKVALNSNSCLDTVRFEFQNPIIACNYWLGGMGSWHNAAKWSTGSVPNDTEIASIYYATDNVGIANNTADVKKIFLDGTLTLTNSGILNVGANATDIGIDGRNATIINNGVINLYDCYTGMKLNPGSVTNNNQINCILTDDGFNINGSSTFVNNSQIQCSGGNSPISCGNSVYVDNYGSIVILNPLDEGIACSHLDNYGSILIDGNGIDGVGISGFVNNLATGTIVAKNLATGAEIGGSNLGVITTRFNEIGFESRGTFTNMAGGQIISSDNNIGASVPSGGIFNLDGGSILINNSGQYGLHVKVPVIFSSTDFENEGLVTIEETTGIGIYNENDIQNKGSGILTVKGSSSHGIHMSSASSYLTNRDQATLVIKDCGGHGLLMDGGILSSSSEHGIHIDSIANSAIYLGDFVTPFGPAYASATNSGLINIGKTASLGIDSETGTIITNAECVGEIRTGQKIRLNGAFNNFGLYRQLGSEVSLIGNNLQNHGLVNDPFASLPSPNMWNLGYYVGEKNGIYDEGQSISNIVRKNSTLTNGFELDTLWYLDKDLSLLGGKYDQSANSFVPNGQSVDSTDFYLQIVNTICNTMPVDTILMTMENPINRVCGKIIWEGGLGSFTQIEKWDKNRLPSACDSVMINGILDSMQLNIATPQSVAHLSNNGLVLISSLSDLTVQNDNGNGVMNAGTIINKGEFTIQNSPYNGYVASVNSQLINEGNIDITNMGQRGADLSYGSINNKSGATFTIDTTSLEGLRLGLSALFNQNGMLVIR